MSNMYERILTLCANKGIKPGKVCADTGLSRGLMSDLKMGRTKQLSAKTVKTIAEYFGVSTDYLIAEEGYGGGTGSGAGWGDGTGYSGPILESDTAYGRAVELCTLYTVNSMSFRDVCQAAGLDDQAIYAWKNGKMPEKTALEKIANYLLVPVDFLLGEGESKKAPTENGERYVSDDDLMFALWGDCEDVDEDDLEDVRRYAAFVRERKKGKK